MKKLFFVLIVLLFANAFAQNPVEKISNKLKSELEAKTSAEKVLVWIYFTDKGNDAELNLSFPEKFLTKKSIERRKKVLFSGSLVDATDLPVNNAYVNELTQAGFELRNKSKWLNAVSGYADRNVIESIKNLSFIKKIDLVGKFSKSKNDIEKPNNNLQLEKYSPQPNGIHSFSYGASFDQLNIMEVPQVHDLGYSGAGITICVMDAGFNNLGHQVFNNINIVDAWDFVNGDPNVGDEGDMGSGSHGTYVLSVIGGFFEGELIGPAFGANFLLAKTENTDSETPVEEDNWVAALEWADSLGVDVTSTSLGYYDYDPPFTSYTWEDMDGNTAVITIAADLAVKKGIVVVNSAGNDAWRGTPNTLIAPADGDSVLSIGAVDASGFITSFSSYGPTFDGRIKPDLVAMGSNVYAARVSDTTRYTSVSGTSFSCPLTSGVVALILEADPNLTPMDVRDLLRNTASRSTNPDNNYGWGIVNAFDAINEIISGVEDKKIPSDYYLLTNYPNPFNPGTNIRFSIPKASNVEIGVYNILGVLVKELTKNRYEAGTYDINFQADGLASGVYFVKLQTNGVQKVHKISLVK